MPHKIFSRFYKREELRKYFSMIARAICLFTMMTNAICLLSDSMIACAITEKRQTICVIIEKYFRSSSLLENSEILRGTFKLP